MVTLIGFFFILGNIGLLVLFMPDLVGPVGSPRQGLRPLPTGHGRADDEDV